MDLLEPRALNPHRAQGRGGNNPGVAEQTARVIRATAKIQTKDISKEARRRDKAETWGIRPRKEGTDWRTGRRQILERVLEPWSIITTGFSRLQEKSRRILN